MNSRRKRLDDHLNNRQKEQKFAGVLRAELIALEYSVAVPEPDTGEDLWLARLVTAARTGATPFIHRAQCKACYSWESKVRKPFKVFSQNTELRHFEYVIKQEGFLYFFGLRQDRVAQYGFHIGCIPSRFFLAAWNDGRVRVGAKNKVRTVNFYFHLYDDGRILFGGRNGWAPDVTKYFGNLTTGIAESRPIM